ncbi:hypothetical protein [Paenibacillus lactis]|uniref:Uncharacterized protein n=1 Tax=Paenibacillus lactis TaxID=228574 RepID=A0ABS4F9N0_9BACL|nr:hypothetical protein [Paenibacillus lactis]MBP1892964.1 hypothetical protein [Paenibacillus lactis]HAF97562.1 hypothetical protein [Paenibacillus lactis]
MIINTVKIDEILEGLAYDNKNRFNAYFVAYLSEEKDIDRVNDYLMMKAQFGVLEVKLETICPNDHVDQQFDWGKLPDCEINCRLCDDDESYFPDPEKTNIVFNFTKEYVEALKKKQQNSQQLIAI